MSTPLSQPPRLEQPVNYWKGLYSRQKKLRSWDRDRHREELANLRLDYKRKSERKVEEFERRCNLKIATRVQEFSEREVVYQQHIARLEAELARYKGRGEKEPKASNKNLNKVSERKKAQGKQRGAGGGRSLHEELTAIDDFIEPTFEQLTCPGCGEVAQDTGLTADSDEVDWRYEIVRRRIRRRKYKFRCRCPETPKIVTADHPQKAMQQSKYSDAFWIQVLVRKFHLQIPLSVTVAELESAGLRKVKETTLIGGIKKVHTLIKPLIEAIVLHCKDGSHHGSDESRLSLFQRFEDDDGKHNGYFWQHHSIDTVVFDFVRRRTSKYLVHFFSEAKTILLADRHKLYKCKAMAALSDVTLAFCWAHQRRDFEKLLDKPGHKIWAGGYIAGIRRIYKCNDKRVKHIDKVRFSVYDKQLRGQLTAFKTRVDGELTEFKKQQADGKGALKPIDPRHIVLDSLDRHWQGLLVFVDNPQVPMDNNKTERNFIKLARYRRNCNGVFSEFSGEIVAAMFTLFYTLGLNTVPVLPYLTGYFEATAQNGGNPLCDADLEAFYPWALSSNVQAAIRRHSRDGPVFEDG